MGQPDKVQQFLDELPEFQLMPTGDDVAHLLLPSLPAEEIERRLALHRETLRTILTPQEIVDIGGVPVRAVTNKGREISGVYLNAPRHNGYPHTIKSKNEESGKVTWFTLPTDGISHI